MPSSTRGRIALLVALTGAALIAPSCFELPDADPPINDDDDTTRADDDDTVEDYDPGDVLELVDANNYSFSATLTIAEHTLAPVAYPCQDPSTEVCDITFDWCNLTDDFLHHPMGAVEDIDMVSVGLFEGHTPEEIADDLRDDAVSYIAMSLFVSNAEFVAGGPRQDECQVALSELTQLGNDIDAEQYFTPELGNGGQPATWLFMISTGTEPLEQVRMAVFLVPDAAQTEDHLTLSFDDTAFDSQADFTSLVPATLPAATTPAAFWTDVSNTGNGVPYNFGRSDQLVITRFESTVPAGLQDHIIELGNLADERWTLDLIPTTIADLSQATGETGSFEGINEEDTWLMWMWNTHSMNPMPQFMTVLEAE